MSQAISTNHRLHRPESRMTGAAVAGAGSCVTFAVAGPLLLIAGSIMMSVAKKGGYYGDKIHNLALYQKGFITVWVGFGIMLPGCSFVRAICK